MLHSWNFTLLINIYINIYMLKLSTLNRHTSWLINGMNVFCYLIPETESIKKKEVQLVIKDKLSDFIDNFYTKLNQYL